MAWNATAIDQLKTALAAGKPAGVIARLLGPGYTRTAVEREAVRMGLKPMAPAPAGRPGGEVPSRRAIDREAPLALNTSVAEGPRFAALTDEDLTPTVCEVVAWGCKWPIGDVGTEGFGFCGRPTSTRRTTFRAHHATVGILATTPEADRRFFSSALRAAEQQAPAA